jgi:hypothetical protein
MLVIGIFLAWVRIARGLVDASQGEGSDARSMQGKSCARNADHRPVEALAAALFTD